jgi:hypothetical protein
VFLGVAMAQDMPLVQEPGQQTGGDSPPGTYKPGVNLADELIRCIRQVSPCR